MVRRGLDCDGYGASRLLAGLLAGMLAVTLPGCTRWRDTPAGPAVSVAEDESLVAFERDGFIRLVGVGGLDERALAPEGAGRDQRHPDWSPDGRSIVFSAEDDDGVRDLFIASLDEGGVRPLVDCVAPCSWLDDPSFTPDGRSVAFQQGSIADDGSRSGTVEVVAVAGGPPRTVFAAPEGQFPRSPRFSPSGAYIVCELARLDETGRRTAERVYASSIAVVELGPASDEARVLTDASMRATHPDWSPDGRSILFGAFVEGRNAPGTGYLYTIDPAGGIPVAVTDSARNGSRVYDASWARAGASMVYSFEDVAGAAPEVAIAGTRDDPGIRVRGITGGHPRLRPESLR
jgi:Tol biopolymer transport system component